ncbi:MAG: dihydroorotase [Thermoprotei archaeon]|nr:dihydroorotase [Thermoprotei archaeon]
MSGYSQSLKGVCVDRLATSTGVIEGVCLEFNGGLVKGFSESPEGFLDFRGLGSTGFPGIVDLHVHLRGLELSYKEDEASGSLAALAGCVTAVVDMPNTKPPLKTPEALEAKLRALKYSSHVDYGVYAGIPYNVEDSQTMASMPIAGFKAYPEDLEAPSRVLCSVLKASESRGLLFIVHPEHPELLKTPDYGFDRGISRPCHAEAAAVDEVSRLLSECGSKPRVHITHASCPQTILKAKAYGFTVDVTPHHLLLDSESFKPLNSLWCESKVNPPLRGLVERSLLWRLLLEGYVDAIASDHAPHAPWEKMWLHPSQCSPGFPSLEVWPGALLRVFRLLGAESLYAKLTSLGPSSILGLRGYGGLGSGFKASLSIFTPEPLEFHGGSYSKARISPYLGFKVLKCLASIIRGRLSYFKGRVLAGEGLGVNMFEPES